MYRIYDRESAINQVLEYLEQTQNGIYDTEAENAVRAHQRKNNISETGVVDYITFISLRDDFRLKEARSVAGNNMLDSPDFPYSFGSYGSDVAIINAMLSDVMELYTIEFPKTKGSYFNKNTANVVSQLRRIFLMPEGEHIDEDFFIRLESERNSKNR